MPHGTPVPGAIRVLAILMLLSVPAHARRAEPPRCPPETEKLIASGWKAYRADSALAALERFDRADRLCPIDLDAKVGLGYSNLRLGYLVRAESLFTRVTLLDPANSDGWDGLMNAAWRLGDNIEALRAARRSWQLHPGDTDTKLILDRIYPGWDRPARAPHKRPDSLVVPARAAKQRFEVPGPGGWGPFYVKGVNLGVALPGCIPGDFPADSARYAIWLESIAGMNANAVRLCTLLPPAFYRALAGWNGVHPQQALWLIQGVWTELPPGSDFDQPRWLAGLTEQTRNVVDAVHGIADLISRPGHACGAYDTDVSGWTLAWVFGREWEPAAVKAYDDAHPGRHMAAGRYLAMADGTAMDGWLAARCDELLDYEVGRYNMLHPIAYASGPTLDPLEHPTERTTAEERALRARFGRPAAARRLEHDHDAVALDPSLVRATQANPAGWFASYHAYPYDPDFMSADPDDRRTRSGAGGSSYSGYLRALTRHHAGLPVLIAEYGVPSSRGNAHAQPQGWSPGGLDEATQAQIDARLTREIRASGCAGGVVSAWMDEWSRQNEAVKDLEVPAERARLWHNAMDPDQHYGILAMDAGVEGASPELGGDPARWKALPVIERAARPGAAGAPVALGVGCDASYIYLAVTIGGRRGHAFGWDSLGLTVALDTYRADRGQRTLKDQLARGDIGFEFVADFIGPSSAELLVTPDYNPYAGPREIERGDDRGRFFRFPVLSATRDDGAFDSLYVIANRARFGRDGTFVPARCLDRGRLRYGALRQSTNSDWTYDAAAGLLEIRLPWALLNVTDPSSCSVLWRDREGGEFGTVLADGFRIGVITWRKGATPRPVAALPALHPGRRWSAADFTTWTWAPWEEPEFHARVKPVYQVLKATWGSMLEELSSAGDAR